MTSFILKRLSAMVFVLTSISILVFLIFFATPGTTETRFRAEGRARAAPFRFGIRH